MAKTISIKKSVYEELKAFKKENESFRLSEHARSSLRHRKIL